MQDDVQSTSDQGDELQRLLGYCGATQYFDIAATNDNSDNDNDNSNNNNAGNNNNNNNPKDNDGQPGGPAATVPGSTAPPAAASLAAAPPAVQKQMIGEMLYPRIAKLQPELAGKITGVMLELDNSELLILLESDAQLKGKVDEALREYNSANNNTGNDKNNNNANDNANDNDNDIAITNNNNDDDRSIEVMPGDAKSTPDQDARGQRRFDELQALQTIKDQQKLREWEKELPNRPVRPTDPCSCRPKPVKPPSVYALTQLERRIDEYERLHPNAAQRWRHGHLEDGDVATTDCEQFDMGRCPKGAFCELISTLNSRGRQPMPPALWPSTLSPPPSFPMDSYYFPPVVRRISRAQ
ncbi:unnamed protein product [Polarella glacialis]|uniref:PABC domain-containing protein n=1 Tax=Polarella glacialis TaxID=89957 RepID=A0A813DK54_POLGL|nr:unnamed protein product [Polarella glacialis]